MPEKFFAYKLRIILEMASSSSSYYPNRPVVAPPPGEDRAPPFPVVPPYYGGYAQQPAVRPPPVYAPYGGQQDWFSQAGLANALSAAAVGAMTGTSNPTTAAALEVQQQKSMSWFQAQTEVFKEYFNVTHSYVLWKLLYVVLPFTESHKGSSVSRSNSREIPHQGEEYEQTGEGNGLGLRLYPGRRPDLYIPIMGYISFVLLFGLSYGKDFHPDNLYNISSLGALLAGVEVVALKAFSYFLNVANWTLTDILAISGYKFVNMSLATLLLILLAGSGRAVWVGVWLLTSVFAGMTVQKSLIAAGDRMQNFLGTGSSAQMEKLLSFAAGASQFLWCWFLMPALVVVVRVAEERHMRTIEPTG